MLCHISILYLKSYPFLLWRVTHHHITSFAFKDISSQIQRAPSTPVGSPVGNTATVHKNEETLFVQFTPKELKFLGQSTHLNSCWAHVCIGAWLCK